MNFDNLKIEVSEDIKALIPTEKLTSLLRAFTQLDSNQSGKIEIDEYLNFFPIKEKVRLCEQFKALDTDRDGRIGFEEFVVASEPTFNILKKFHELDLDRNGLLSLEEAIHIADCLTIPLNEEQIKTILKQADRDGSGQITYHEYLGAIAHLGFQ